MASKRLKRLGFSQPVLDRLTKQGFRTCKDVLSKNGLELLRVLGVSYAQVQCIIHRVCSAAVPPCVTALDQWRRVGLEWPAYLTTSLPELDQVLHGGLPVATITEIAGPSGCGKTQFCIMLSVLATLPPHLGGLDGTVIFIDTECAFTAERLVEIGHARFPDHYSDRESLVNLSSRVRVHTESTCARLMKRLENLEEELITNKVRLIIVDSIASLVRKEFDSRTGSNMVERTNLLTKQAALLKYLAESFNIPVVVTNQITTRYGKKKPATEEDDEFSTETSPDSSSVSLEGEGGYVTAALGTTWSHSVNTRLILQYLTGSYRQVLVAKSPIAPFANFIYTVQESGLVLEEGGADHYEGTDPGLQQIRVRSAVRQDLHHC